MTEQETKQLEDFCQQLPKIQELAKALWGIKEVTVEKDVKLIDGSTVRRMKQESYTFHLQQMVVADDPIAYLAENI